MRKKSSPFLPRRRSKFPLILSVVLFALMGFFAYRHYLPGQDTDQLEPHIHKTWSSFSEMRRLSMLLQGFSVSSMADVPCTDICDLDLTSLPIARYLGVLGEKRQAQELQKQYGSSKASFMRFDPSVDVLPRVDLILCWDKLCTLSPQEIRATLLLFKKSGAKFLLMRHFPQLKQNESGERGCFRPINWKIPPYNFPEPIIHIVENGEHGMESLALWNLEDLS